jgi:NAD(P)-dependent dehydrogenase (short-subunit alcohol dehydrogenase family)
MTVGLAIPEPAPLDGVLSLQGKCAVVTGGSRGLGEAIVQRLAEAGASGVFTGRKLETLRPVEAEVAAAGGTAVAFEAAAARIADTQRAIDLAKERFGRGDILVNNAAVFEPRLFLETTEELWDRTRTRST